MWCWSRPQQDWILFADGSPIVDVQLIPSGILVIAEQSAVLFDTHLGRYLTVLSSNEVLVEGGGDADTSMG